MKISNVLTVITFNIYICGVCQTSYILNELDHRCFLLIGWTTKEADFIMCPHRAGIKTDHRVYNLWLERRGHEGLSNFPNSHKLPCCCDRKHYVFMVLERKHHFLKLFLLGAFNLHFKCYPFPGFPSTHMCTYIYGLPIPSPPPWNFSQTFSQGHEIRDVQLMFWPNALILLQRLLFLPQNDT